MCMPIEIVQQECEIVRAGGCGNKLCFAQRFKADQEWFRSKLHRGKGRSFPIITANVTSWNSGLQVFREGGFGGAAIVLLQDDRLQDNGKILAARHQLERVGWRSFFKPPKDGEEQFTGSRHCLCPLGFSDQSRIALGLRLGGHLQHNHWRIAGVVPGHLLW